MAEMVCQGLLDPEFELSLLTICVIATFISPSTLYEKVRITALTIYCRL